MIPTVDAVELLKSSWASKLATYPEGSISPRTILITLPLSIERAEETAAKLNFELTKEIYQRATVFAQAEAERISVKRRLGGVMSFMSGEQLKAEQEKVSNGVLEIAKRYLIK